MRRGLISSYIHYFYLIISVFQIYYDLSVTWCCGTCERYLNRHGRTLIGRQKIRRKACELLQRQRSFQHETSGKNEFDEDSADWDF